MSVRLRLQTDFCHAFSSTSVGTPRVCAKLLSEALALEMADADVTAYGREHSVSARCERRVLVIASAVSLATFPFFL